MRPVPGDSHESHSSGTQVQLRLPKRSWVPGPTPIGNENPERVEASAFGSLGVSRVPANFVGNRIELTYVERDIPVRFAVSVLIVVAAACSSPASDRVISHDEWGTYFAEEGLDGTMVVQDLATNEIHVFDEGRADQAYLPASTFKILNSLIILETGALPDVDTVVEWDGVDHGVAAWNRDHSLRTGIEVSAVWLYQAMARRVGSDSMEKWVAETGYGNADIGGDIDSFWLDGNLRISAREQVDFLTRLARGDLPFSPGTVASVREIIVREFGENWSWSHKTGTTLSSEPHIGWLVGFASHQGDEWAFAMNVDLAPRLEAAGQLDPTPRLRVARRVLEALGALPGG